MKARALPLGILVAASLIALAGVSGAGTGRVTGYPWTGTGNQHGRQGNGNRDGCWSQPERADWTGHGHREGWLSQGDRDPWEGNTRHRSGNDDCNDRDQQERPKPPWGGPLGEGGHLGW